MKFKNAICVPREALDWDDLGGVEAARAELAQRLSALGIAADVEVDGEGLAIWCEEAALDAAARTIATLPHQ